MDTIPCSRCRGRGLLLLRETAPHLADTLDWLRANGPATAKQAHRALAMPGTSTAMNNRLEALRELGLVSRPRKVCKEWLYGAVPSHAPTVGEPPSPSGASSIKPARLAAP